MNLNLSPTGWFIVGGLALLYVTQTKRGTNELMHNVALGVATGAVTQLANAIWEQIQHQNQIAQTNYRRLS